MVSRSNVSLNHSKWKQRGNYFIAVQVQGAKFRTKVTLNLLTVFIVLNGRMAKSDHDALWILASSTSKPRKSFPNFSLTADNTFNAKI